MKGQWTVQVRIMQPNGVIFADNVYPMTDEACAQEAAFQACQMLDEEADYTAGE